ncbi:MAG TPA: hypothetical protein VK153_03110 [Candidatus Paceibacterota bacterium]|nr:hypothetical protein [Candidatus Paceibacterota bacterium]
MDTKNLVVEDYWSQYPITSKEEGLRLLMDMAYKRIINKEEFNLLANQLRDSEVLPDNDYMSNHVAGYKKSSKGFTALIELLSFISFSDPNKNVALFKTCNCEMKHGRIYYRGGFTSLLDSKERAISLAKTLHNLSKEELENVKRQIEGSNLFP